MTLIDTPAEPKLKFETTVISDLLAIDQSIELLDAQGMRQPDTWPVILPAIEALTNLREFIRSLIF